MIHPFLFVLLIYFTPVFLCSCAMAWDRYDFVDKKERGLLVGDFFHAEAFIPLLNLAILVAVLFDKCGVATWWDRLMNIRIR